MTNLCGVDVSKAWLDVWIETAGHRRFANSAGGVAELGTYCRAHDVELVVMEASGGIERAAFLGLWQAGQPCALANARSVRQFAQAMGYLEKTDRIDAMMIARFAQAKRMVATPPPSADQQQLTALATRLRQVTGDLGVQKQRLHSAREPAMRDSLRQAIAFFTAQADDLAARIAALIGQDPLWEALDRSFRQIKGVADRTIAYLLAELPEIGTLSNRAVTKLVGLAPLAHDSGQHRGRRSIRGGRAGLRSILFLVADIARRFDQSLTDFRQRLLAKGLSKMEVRIALARKLLVRLNAKARDTRAALTTNP
ncbi:IS110 family transposase [Sphingomonas zeae]|jgi:transposase